MIGRSVSKLIAGAAVLLVACAGSAPPPVEAPSQTVAPRPVGSCSAPDFALVLVIDRSGSMQGERMARTLEAAHALLPSFDARDRVGIVAFDSVPERMSPPRCAIEQDALHAAIDRIEPRGGTEFLGALEMAIADLDEPLSARAARRHVLFLSDGQGPPAGVFELVRSAADRGITLSTAALGPDAADLLLREMATAGKGRFFAISDLAELNAVFANDISLAR